jgi:hypothetical protein
LLLASAGLLITSSVPLTHDAVTGIFAAVLVLGSFVALTFTRLDSAWVLIGAAILGLAAQLVGFTAG